MALSSDAALILGSTSACATIIVARCIYRALFRCHIHQICHRLWHNDDFYVIIAIFPLIARAVCIFHSVALNPERTYEPATPADAMIYGLSVTTLNSNRELSLKLLIPSRIFYILFLWCLKLGLLAFYSRLFVNVFRWGKLATDALWWFVIMSFIAIVIATVTQCQPISVMWTLNHDHQEAPCNTAVANLILMGVCNLVSSFALIALPFPILLHLQLSIWKKVQLGLLFSVGGLIVAVTILRLPRILNESVSQRSRSMWASIEIVCASVVSNSPFFYALLKDLRRRHDDRLERSLPIKMPREGSYNPQSLPSSSNASTLDRSALDTTKVATCHCEYV